MIIGVEMKCCVCTSNFCLFLDYYINFWFIDLKHSIDLLLHPLEQPIYAAENIFRCKSIHIENN